MRTVLRVENLSKTYVTGGETVVALNGVSFEADRGEFIALMGSSGSGKSTLLHLIAALDTASGGTVSINGESIAEMSDRGRTLFRRTHIGIVFQSFNLLPTLTALENIALPLMIAGISERSSGERARELLSQFDLERRASHRPAALSGGEQQRVAIARALVIDPAIILADEPTGNLDSRHAQDIWQLLLRLCREHDRTIVAVTHESDGARYADRVIVLRDGAAQGEFTTGGDMDATGVAARYQELAG